MRMFLLKSINYPQKLKDEWPGDNPTSFFVKLIKTPLVFL
jgi:hypothetical protein